MYVFSEPSTPVQFTWGGIMGGNKGFLVLYSCIYRIKGNGPTVAIRKAAGTQTKRK